MLKSCSAGLASLALGIWIPLLAAAGVAQEASAVPIPVAVALEPLRGPAGTSLEDPQRWLRIWTDALVADGSRLGAVDVWVSDGRVVEFLAGSDAVAELRARANGLPLVVATVTRLVDHYGLEVRVLGPGPLEARIASFAVHGDDQLTAAFSAAASAVRAALGAASELLADAGPGLQSAGPPDRSADEEPDSELPSEAPSAAASERLSSSASASALSTSREDSSDRPKVVEIRVEGTGRIEPDAIRAALHIHPGDPLEGLDLGAEVRRIYALGFFRDVEVLSEQAPGGRVVTFVVEENPVIREIAISGNHDIGPDEIREQLTLTVGSTIDYPLLVENRARIQAFYATRGYYLSTVDFKVEPFSEGSISVDFVIDEGRKLRLVEVSFEGNEFLSDAELHGVMETRPWTWKSWVSHYWDRSGVYAEPVFYQDLDRIRRKYADSGFIRARATDPEVTHDESGLHVRVQIEEGERFRVGKVDVVGDETMDRDELMSLVSMKPGELFRRSDLTRDVDALESHYKDRGFYFSKVSAQTDVNPETQVIDCAFEVEKGDLYFVDRIEVSGNRTTRDHVVRRELSLAEGELYAADALERSRARVQRLGFFEEVQLKAHPTDAPGRVAVDVDVVERPTGSFSFGAGVGSTDGFILNAGLRKQNLFGRGYGATLNANVGGRTKRFFLRFSNPYAFGTAANYGITLSRTDIKFISFSQKITGFDWTVGYPLDEGQTRVFAGYSFTSRETTGLDVQASSLLQREEAQKKNVSSLFQFSFRHDARDDLRFPKRGYQYGGSIEWAGFGGINRFLRAETGGTWYFPLHDLLPFESTFVVNSRVGWVIPFNSLSDFGLPGCGGDPSVNSTCAGSMANFNAMAPGSFAALADIDRELKLPLTERYFLGGLGLFQVRGFRRRSLGPRRAILTPSEQPPGSGQRFFTASCKTPANLSNCNSIDDKAIKDFKDLNLTDVIGGSKFALVNTELRFPVSQALGLEGLVFLDAGNAFAEDETINPLNFRFGTGIGAQWFSPFGPILVQIGVPLDRLADEKAKVFEFSFGGSRY